MSEATLNRRNGKTALIMLGIIAAMVALVSVTPRIYTAFCEATGLGGTTRRAETAPGAVAGKMSIRFDANVQPGLPWKFEPVQKTVTVAPGARTQILYRAENLSDRTITGQAVYNVSPDQAGKYFNKIACFCFNEQTLKPHEKVDMPVVFFVDPKMLDDPDANTVTEITLSYTFYPVETGARTR